MVEYDVVWGLVKVENVVTALKWQSDSLHSDQSECKLVSSVTV